MKDPYPLVRAIEVILSLNDNVLQTNGLEKAKELAKRGLSNYNSESNEVEEGTQTCQCICWRHSLKSSPLKNK